MFGKISRILLIIYITLTNLYGQDRQPFDGQKILDSYTGIKQFYITDGHKTKTIKQSDYFTVYLFSPDIHRRNEVYEGFLLKAEDQTYYFDMFFEEYEDIGEDTNVLVKNRCDLTEACDRFISLSQHNIEYVEHNTNSKVTMGKICFLASLGSLFATTYFAFKPGLFENSDGTNVDTGKKTMFVGGGLGMTALTFGVGLKLINPRRYHFNYKQHKQRATWYIEE